MVRISPIFGCLSPVILVVWNAKIIPDLYGDTELTEWQRNVTKISTKKLQDLQQSAIYVISLIG
jgi:hypothetical protein